MTRGKPFSVLLNTILPWCYSWNILWATSAFVVVAQTEGELCIKALSSKKFARRMWIVAEAVWYSWRFAGLSSWEQWCLRREVPFYSEKELYWWRMHTSKGSPLAKKAGVYEQGKDLHCYWHEVVGPLHLTGSGICYLLTWTTKQQLPSKLQKVPPG